MKRTLTTSLFAALPFALAAGGLNAQDVEVPQVCTATVQPAELPAGEAAVQLTATLSQDIGMVSTIEAAMSGLAIASPEDLPRAEMASDTETPEAIAMVDEGHGVALWLSTLEAAEGTYQVVLQGAEGSCTAEVTVKAPAN